MSSATDNAVFNVHIAVMFTPASFRLIRLVLILPILLLAATACGQNWAGAEEQFAAKIVAVTGPRTMTVEVSNRSSLGTTNADDIRRGLLTQLAALGARFVNAEQAAAAVRVSLSESLQNYVWVAEIRLGTNEASVVKPAVVIVSLPRPGTPAVEPEAAMVLHKTPLWSQQERILDVSVIERNPERNPEGNPAHMLVLDSRGVVIYRLQDGRWQ